MCWVTAPERIWLQVQDENKDEPFVIDETTWCQDNINDHDIEYYKALPQSIEGTEVFRITPSYNKLNPVDKKEILLNLIKWASKELSSLHE